MSGRSSAAPVMVASDLDRTLIYSANSMSLVGSDHLAPRMVVAEVYDAAPLSFMTRAAEGLLEWVAEQSVFVPVTTRTQAQFSRVQLPRAGQGYAVTTNGAVLLHDGEPDADWSRHMQRSLGSVCAPLDVVLGHLTGSAAHPAILRIRTAEDCFIYGIVDRDALTDAYLEELGAWCDARGWTTSLQGRKLYCVPVPITKEAAVAEVRRRTGAGLLVAAGDSRLDAGILELADVAIRPAHGELESDGFSRPNLTVTSTSGVLAGEEIARFFRDILTGTGNSTSIIASRETSPAMHTLGN
ncbi:HAD family hydrolase [Arthrobacter sp. UKPF54-2]|uniref:HAD family hydrolase n=1 Tax=Arthrobacter sp. UKPF54-2 TaxID=2600159 RepID=UPI001C98A62A|nr:HAD family hydrolase [Arthrobacter sp. UKPF54-2]